MQELLPFTVQQKSKASSWNDTEEHIWKGVYLLL